MRETSDLVGRTHELETLGQWLEGDRGGLVLIDGESGVGKTALVERSLRKSSRRIFQSKPMSESPQPFGALLPFLGKESADPENFPRTLESRLGQVSRKRPVALFLDDAHAADLLSLETLPSLVPFLQSHPVILILAYRSDEVTVEHPIRRMRTRLRRESSVWEMTVHGLPDEAVAELVSFLFDAEPSPELLQQITERAGGLPLYIEELCTALESDSRLTRTPTGLALPDSHSIPLPDSIRDLVSLQMTTLSSSARDTLEGAAVAGNDFAMEMLVRLGCRERAIDELLQRRLLVERAGRGSFRHPLLREAVQDEIPWSRRRKLNSRLADLLARTDAPGQRLAEHLLAAGREDEACESLLAAAEEACHANDFWDAARLFERALPLWPDTKSEEERLVYLERMARCAESGGRLKDSAKSWRELIASPLVRDNPERLAEAYCSLATVQERMGAEGPATEARAAAIQTFEKAGLIAEAATAALEQAETAIVRSRLSPGRQMATRALELAKRAEKVELESRALSAIGLALSMEGRKTVARRRIEAALEMALEHGLKEAAAVAYQRMSYVFAYVGDFKGQREAFGTAIGFCQREGLESERISCLGCMSYALFRLGEWKRAAAICREIIETNEPDDVGRVIAESVLGTLYAARGQIRQARRILEKADDDARRFNIVPVELITRPGLAWTDEQAGDDAGAAIRYRELLAFRRQTEDTFDVLPGLRQAALFFGRMRASSELGLCADAARELASRNRNPDGLGTVAFTLGECALLHGHPEEAARQFLVAKAEFSRIEATYEVALSGAKAGEAHRKAGRVDFAIEELAESRRIAGELGARPLLEWADRELAAAGGRTRTSDARRASLAGLTRRQSDVAKLVAEGLTNKEIAQRLHLSPRTVDMHVSAILDRLDCRTRSEATRKLVDLGAVD